MPHVRRTWISVNMHDVVNHVVYCLNINQFSHLYCVKVKSNYFNVMEILRNKQILRTFAVTWTLKFWIYHSPKSKWMTRAVTLTVCPPSQPRKSCKKQGVATLIMKPRPYMYDVVVNTVYVTHAIRTCVIVWTLYGEHVQMAYMYAGYVRIVV